MVADHLGSALGEAPREVRPRHLCGVPFFARHFCSYYKNFIRVISSKELCCTLLYTFNLSNTSDMCAFFIYEVPL